MKLVRYGNAGQEKPGLIDGSGQLRDLSGVIRDLSPDVLSAQSLASLAALRPADLPAVAGKPRLGVPVQGSQKFIAIGLNYSDHAAESGLQVPPEPVIFTKQISCLSGPFDDVVLPSDSKEADWEVELGFVIGTKAKYVSDGKGLDHVAGYCVVNDVSEREYQIKRSGQWTKGKSADTFGPVGPWLVTRDEIADPQNLNLWLELNGERVQNGSTKSMVYGVSFLVSYLSRFFTLMPGDIICTGTPPGVGMGMKPPRYLKEGDIMRLSVDGLGTQEQHVTRYHA